jgi:tetratricopeptide (TPR) repeat protein
MHPFSLRKKLLPVAAFVMAMTPCFAIESSNLNSQSNWLTHATLSYQEWQQGNISSAQKEGEDAVRLNPENAVAVVNLALIKQRNKDYDGAMALYWQGAKLLPDSWVPPLGIARCYILSNDEENSRDILQMMSERKHRDFSWYYMTAKTWLEIDKPDKAAETAEQAAKVAITPDQRAAAENLQLLALLRAEKTEQAKSLQENVLRNNSPRQAELYVRSALMILPSSDPVAGKELLTKAVQNLNNPTDADALFKLGIIFQNKADESKDDSIRKSWLENAQSALAQAIAIQPKSADYHFALADIYCRTAKLSQAADQLKIFSSLDYNDHLAPILIPKLLSSENSISASAPVNFSIARFNISGLNCSCHRSKVYKALLLMKGVAYVSIPPNSPYPSWVLLDPAIIPVSEMILKCNTTALAPEVDSAGKSVKIKLELTSEEPVKTATEAFKVVSTNRFKDAVSFNKNYSEYQTRFQDVNPIMPANQGTTDGAITASNWKAPL